MWMSPLPSDSLHRNILEKEKQTEEASFKWKWGHPLKKEPKAEPHS